MKWEWKYPADSWAHARIIGPEWLSKCRDRFAIAEEWARGYGLRPIDGDSHDVDIRWTADDGTTEATRVSVRAQVSVRWAASNFEAIAATDEVPQ